MSTTFHIAEINIARMRVPLEHPSMADFTAQLDLVNAIADASPGFVWRLKSDAGVNAYVQAFDDPLILVNLSVWETLETLKDYVYRTHEHAAVFRDRRRWFEPPEGPPLAIWWIRAGDIPTVEEGRERLALLTRVGPTQEAFTFKAPFPRPGFTSPIPG